MKTRQSIIALTIAGAVAVGIAAPASATPSVAPTSSVQVASAPTFSTVSFVSGGSTASSVSVASLASGVAASSTSAASTTATAQAASSQLGPAVRAFVAAIKAIPGLWTKTVAAVKAGYAKFVALYNSLPGFVKWIVNGVSIVDIWNEIQKYI